MRVSCLSVSVGAMCLLLLWQPALAEEESEVNKDRNPCNCACGQYSRGGKIIGGVEAQVNEFPWIVYFSLGRHFLCGGSLITARHVLTAAHCIHRIPMKYITVAVGAHNRSTPSSEVQTRKVLRMSPHSEYNEYTFNNDIAVLELDRPVKLSEAARVACLPLSDDEDYSGRMATVAGWGSLSATTIKRSETLQKVSVPILSQDECRNGTYSGRVFENMLCAGFEYGTKDSCQGDSGGPLQAMVNNFTEVVGVVSWGEGCARPNYPGVYTRVGRYIEWIDEQLDGECRCTRRQGHSHRTPRIMEEDY